MAPVLKQTPTNASGFKARVLLVLLALGVCTVVQAANIYRYQDENGRTVFNSSIPPEFIKNGYTVLNERGEVVEVVSKAPSAEELVRIEAQQEIEAEEQQRLRQQREADNLLLRLYRTPEEVARKRDIQLVQIDAQITTVEVSLEKLSEELADLQQRVTRTREALGAEPTAEQLVQQEQQQAESLRLEEQLERYRSDRERLVAAAERDMARLRVLLNLPE